MSQIQRLVFHEHEEQWYITEIHDDGHTQPGEPFMASGHERFPKLEQVLGRVDMKYTEYRVVDAVGLSADLKNIAIDVVLK